MSLKIPRNSIKKVIWALMIIQSIIKSNPIFNIDLSKKKIMIQSAKRIEKNRSKLIGFFMTKFVNRESAYPIQPLLLSRVSSRAFGEERLTEDELMTLFEAARWAPSSFNGQPWRFVYARRGEKEWETLFNVLTDFNKSWCKNADTLVVAVSRNNFEKNNKPARTSHFDTGSAWMSLALEAHARNIVTHGMEGFDYDAIKKALAIPEGFTVEAMIAIGKPGNIDTLPEKLQEMEFPSTRKPLNEMISKGNFPFK
jgi:nitroreductase